MLDACFGSATKQVEATLVNPIQNMTGLGDKITILPDDGFSINTTNISDVSINPAVISPEGGLNMQLMSLISQASQRWGGNVRCIK
ncbi:hypothetical protein D3C71_1972520 [compost metagenome]